MSDLPLISCLCVTHKKPDMLRRAIRCFDNQRYHNKQMVIVYEESDQPTHEYIIQQCFDANIKIIKINAELPKKTLGELRNISVREAEGNFVCQWDDDDWYNPDRLSNQMNHLLLHEKPANILTRWIVVDACAKKVFLSNKYLWEGSILCRRDLMLQIPYPSLARGEDSYVIESLYKQGYLSVINHMPYLYVYTYHGNNTWDAGHFQRLIGRCRELSLEDSEKVLNTIANC